jgi:hypothetical protein
MKTLTVAEIMALNPCEAYPESRVLELWQGKNSLTALEILSLDIPPEDRLWVMMRNGVLPDGTLRQFANTTADRAVRNHCLTTCGVPAVEAWARNWIDGTNRTTYAAYAAADAADAAADAAYAAADAADAADAARAAAYAADVADAAYAAAYAARAAAYAAAYAADVAYAARAAAYAAAYAADVAYAAYAAAFAAWAARAAADAAADAAERQLQIADLVSLLEVQP